MCRAHRRARAPLIPTARACSRTATPARSPPAASERRSPRSTSRPSSGKRVEVFADETRPLLQGSRLTAWELDARGNSRDGARRQRGGVADARRRDRSRASSARIASRQTATSPTRSARTRWRSPRGTTAFRSTSPRRSSTVRCRDARRATTSSSSNASADEVRCGFGAARRRPAGVDVYNPAFDVTPAALITAIISDRGVHRAAIRLSRTPMKHVLAIDEGTTGATCLMIGEDGRVAGRGYREIPQYFPQPGWVEHDAIEILERVRVAAREAIADGRRTRRSRSASRTSARRSSSGSARPGKPRASRDRLAGSAHRRSAARARAASATGSPSAPASSPIRTSRRRRSSGCCARTTCSSAIAPSDLAVGTIDTWLIWQLTGGAVHATDPTNASRTMLYDIDRTAWSDELCELFGVPMEMLPEVRPSSGDFGVRTRDALGVDDSDSRRRRRSAGGAVRPGMLDAGHGQEHVRHRRVSAAQRRATSGPRRRRRIAHDDRVRRDGRAGVRARGGDLHRRRGGAMAARRTRHHRERAPRPRRSRARSSRPTASTSFPR